MDGNELNDKMIEKLNKLNDIATSRGQTLSQMALSWVLHNKAVTTVLIGASRPEQITENIGDRKSTRLNSSHMPKSRMPSSA